MSVEVPYKKVASSTNLSKIDVELNLEDQHAQAAYVMTGTNRTPQDAEYSSLFKKENAKLTVQDQDFTNKALFVKVTAKDKVAVKYYKIVVTMKAASTDVAIHKGTIAADVGDPTTQVDIQGATATPGTYGAEAALTATLPYAKDGTVIGCTSATMSLSVEKNADVKVMVWDRNYEVEKAADFKGNNLLTKTSANPNPENKDEKIWVFDSMELATLASANNNNCYVYILVTAEDGKTYGIYELVVDMKAAGESARLTEVTTKLNGEAVGTTPDLSQDPSKSSIEQPVELEVQLPAGDYYNGLNVAVKAGDNAKITYYVTDNKFATDASKLMSGKGSLELGTVQIDTPVYIKVESEKANAATAFYKLTIKVSDLADKESGDDVTLDLEKKMVVVTGGEVTAEELLGGIVGNDLIILNAEGEDVTGEGKVGTGYKVKSGSTTLDVVVKGDVNGSATISITDITAAANDILDGGNTLEPLNNMAADMNDDGKVSITDITAMANLILDASK